jgi:hypothetical protein
MRAVIVAVCSLFCLATSAMANPPEPSHSTDPDRCRWEWMSGGGLGVWAERCAFDTGVWQLRYAADLPGFILTVDGEDDVTVLQLFTKAAGADISAILPELRRRGYTADNDECLFKPLDIGQPAGPVAFFDIQPTGSLKAAFEATPDDIVPDPPCGDYGWSTHGVRYFMTDTRFPDRAVYIDIGQDGLMFDEKTVTLQ